jgi:hypothetical protein
LELTINSGTEVSERGGERIEMLAEGQPVQSSISLYGTDALLVPGFIGCQIRVQIIRGIVVQERELFLWREFVKLVHFGLQLVNGVIRVGEKASVVGEDEAHHELEVWVRSMGCS